MSVLITNSPGYCNRNEPITLSWKNTSPTAHVINQIGYEILYKTPGSSTWSTLGYVNATASSTTGSCSINDIWDEIGVDAEEYYIRVRVMYGNVDDGGIDYSDIWSIAFHGNEVGTLKAYNGSETISIPLYDSVENEGPVIHAMINSSTEGQAALVNSYSPFVSRFRTPHGSAAIEPDWNTRRGYANGYFYKAPSYGYGYAARGYKLDYCLETFPAQSPQNVYYYYYAYGQRAYQRYKGYYGYNQYYYSGKTYYNYWTRNYTYYYYAYYYFYNPGNLGYVYNAIIGPDGSNGVWSRIPLYNRGSRPVYAYDFYSYSGYGYYRYYNTTTNGYGYYYYRYRNTRYNYSYYYYSGDAVYYYRYYYSYYTYVYLFQYYAGYKYYTLE